MTCNGNLSPNTHHLISHEHAPGHERGQAIFGHMDERARRAHGAHTAARR
jgi:hypothetical protein